MLGGSEDLREFVELERVVGSEAEIEDALDALAALLLDRAQEQGDIPTPSLPTIRPTARHARGSDPPRFGAVGT
jgi:hypothetical protein